jgi:hypothetical protein
MNCTFPDAIRVRILMNAFSRWGATKLAKKVIIISIGFKIIIMASSFTSPSEYSNIFTISLMATLTHDVLVG